MVPQMWGGRADRKSREKRGECAPDHASLPRLGMPSFPLDRLLLLHGLNVLIEVRNALLHFPLVALG